MSATTEINGKQESAKAGLRTSPTLKDGLFLTLIVLLSCVLYTSWLGFYSDDWVFLGLLKGAVHHSPAGWYQALYVGDVVIRQRPAQIIYLAILYGLFGLQPLGYHLANTLLLVAGSLFFYLSLRVLKLSRFLALAIPLVFILLPNYSTDRFWIAAHQATLSIVFYFISLYADLKAIQDYPLHLRRWKSISILSLVISGLAYEVTLPLFLLNPLLAWYLARQKYGKAAGDQIFRNRALILFVGNYLALAMIIAFKLLITIRTNVAGGILSHILDIIAGAARVNFGTYGIGLPYILWWILNHHPNLWLLLLSGVVGIMIFGYLYQLSGQSANDFSSRNMWMALIGLGLLVFGLGFAVFIANNDTWFTSTSLGNRINIAATIGLAMLFSGVIGWISLLFPSRLWRRSFFCLLVACLCASGFMITNTLAGFWVTAYQQQQEILADIRAHIPALPEQSVLILDAVCLEHGGAYSFTGGRDLAALLRIAYEDQSIWATAITNRPQIGAGGLTVSGYRSQDYYPYGEKLFVYNDMQKQLYRLTDAVTARQYFQNSGFIPEQQCSPGFAWGLNAN